MTFTVVGHRGAMGLEPENTLRSFLRAEREGVDEIELDLWLSKDGQLVILHDGNVERTTNGTGDVAGMTLAEIKQLDAGLGESVPTFDEVLDVVTVPIQAEIKTMDAARAAIDTIRDRGLLDRITVTSFHADVLSVAKEYLPEVRTGLIYSGAPAESVETAMSLGASIVCPGIGKLGPELVERAHEAGLGVFTWPVNDVDVLAKARELGVDGITTDYPDAIREALGSGVS
ncbi:glycerophosphodiester phosphodiesterase [Flindersiella endophytica]